MLLCKFGNPFQLIPGNNTPCRIAGSTNHKSLCIWGNQLFNLGSPGNHTSFPRIKRNNLCIGKGNKRLVGNITGLGNNKLVPIYYAKLADEGGTYRKDEVNYTYDGLETTGKIRLYRPKRNAVEDYILTEPGIVYDMLSIFYVIRSFDFRNMEMNQIYKTKIFSGKSLEYLNIEYLGQEILKQNKKEYSTFKVRFRFYDDTGKKTSDNISAWIGIDDRRIPLKVEGKLPLGSMKAVYTGQ